MGTPRRGRAPSRYLYILAGLLTILLAAGCAGGRFSAASGWSGVVDGGDLVYVGSMAGTLLALDAESGATEWEFPRETDGSGDEFGSIYGTPTLANGLIYAGGYNGRVYAVTAGRASEDGGLKEWQFEVGIVGGIEENDVDEVSKGVVGSVVVAEGKAVFGAAVDSENGRLYVLDAADGLEQCRYPETGTIGKIWSSPAVTNGIAYFGDLNHSFYAVSLEDCSLQWPAPIELDGGIASTPLVIAGKVYVGAFDRNFYAIDAKTGQADKLFTADNWFWSGVASDGSALFIPSLDGKLYAMSLSTGALLWEPFNTEGSILSAPVVVGNRVAVASDAETLFVLGTRDGILDWSFQIGADVRAPLMAKGSAVYLSAMDRTIHAIDVDERAPLRRWPVKTR
jgi:outer membrane protein assembly factor BamB